MSMIPYLQGLGVSDLFSSNADLSEIVEEGGVYVSDIIHQAVVEVDEEGTEAAAATAVFVTKSMAVMVDRDEPKLFRADHPFTFYIKHNPSGMILFLGHFNGE